MWSEWPCCVFHPGRISQGYLCISSYSVHEPERSAGDGFWGEDWMNAWLGMRRRRSSGVAGAWGLRWAGEWAGSGVGGWGGGGGGAGGGGGGGGVGENRNERVS